MSCNNALFIGEGDTTGFSMEGLKKTLAILRKADIAWGLVALCCFEKVIGAFTHSTLLTFVLIN